MSKLIILSLGKGTLEGGFPFVTVQLQEESNNGWKQFQGSLPPEPKIIDLYRRWQLLYDLLYEARSVNIGLRQPENYNGIDDDGIDVDESDVTHVSGADFDEVCKQLQISINNWLECKSFRTIESQLRTQLAKTDEIRFIIQTEDYYLRKLPWHVWSFFQDYPLAEIALSPIEFQLENKIESSSRKIRILAILGDSKGINIDADKQALQKLPNNPEIVFLIEPNRQELDAILWDKQGWDILFFAGHSSSKANGNNAYLYINTTESLTILQLKNSLQKAIERGLKLAIFNSCDGLGLARQLDDLHIPQIIVMREPVPDRVAQEFLKRFLQEFAYGESFYLAVRQAREQLQGLETEFPGASWLPVICQNPAHAPLSWAQMYRNYGILCSGSVSLANERTNYSSENKQHNPKAKFKPVALLISIASTFVVSGIRNQGILQHGELQIYDQMVRLKNDENIDSRLLIIEVTEEDLQYQNQLGFARQGSLSDEALAQIVARIEALKPSVIGLDIYRDFPVEKSKAKSKTNLAEILNNNDNFFAICKHNDPLVKHPGTAPPNEVPNERLGFSDVVADSDGVLRRYVFQMTANINSPCPTETSFSFQLALHYLHKKGLKVIPEITKDGNVQLGKVTLPIITGNWGGYQNLEDKGYQMMLNYRSRNIAKKITLTKVLQGKFKPDLVKNKIVLIGTTAPTFKDELYTPYSLNRQPDQAMHGVIVQAQMVSQIISAILDKRPLVRVWSNWLGTIWIAGWSFIAGGIALYCRKPITLVLLTLLTISISSVSSFGFFVIQSTWIPIIPASLVIVIVVVVSSAYKSFPFKNFWTRL